MNTRTHSESCSCWQCLEQDMNQHLIANGVDPSRYGSGPSEADNRTLTGGGRSSKINTVSVAPGALATEKQLAFLTTLITTRDWKDVRVPKGVDKAQLGKSSYRAQLNRTQCSKLITAMIDLPQVPGTGPVPTEKQVAYWRTLVEHKLGKEALDTTPVPSTRADISLDIDRLRKLDDYQSPKASERVTQDGMYSMGGVVYKVQQAIGSTRLYAKMWNAEEKAFQFAKGAISQLRPEHRMTLEQAKEFGHLYGYCCRCGRRLTDESSIEAGIGRYCAGKW